MGFDLLPPPCFSMQAGQLQLHLFSPLRLPSSLIRIAMINATIMITGIPIQNGFGSSLLCMMDCYNKNPFTA